jgi:copper(I)-binding protein
LIEEAVVTASSTRRGRIRLVAGSALVGALLALSACSAGQLAQTAQQQSAIAGVNGQTADGRVALRNALIPFNGPQGYQQGGNAPMAVSIFNNGPNAVKLVDVSAQDASDVVLVGGAGTNVVPSPSAPPPSPTATASPSAAPSPTTTAPSGQTSFSITIASGGYAVLTQQDGTYLQLVGLHRSLASGDTVPVVFSFDDGSSATMTLPVGPATAVVPRNPAVATTSGE